ncbi:hypothetical protein I6M49_21700 [Shewanella algae]|uniref:hypothetical protein n=1 Tax=Shewanella algae TaxID=38313 RepID=UPI001AADEBFD|nr:hypothetical protein [Shewanella algae]MBO2656062.1 hypothetical protein [Shewanella algae]
MHQIDNETTTPEMPPFEEAVIPGWFTKGGQGKAATYPGADWFNMVQAELLNVLVAAGITPDKASLNQLASAITALISNQIGDLDLGGFLTRAANLSDVENTASARANLDVPSNPELDQALADLADSLSLAITNSMSAHLAATDPHSQYMTSPDTSDAISAALAGHKAETNPHSQYATTTALGAAIEAHKTETNAHPASSIETALPGVPGDNLEETLLEMQAAGSDRQLKTLFWVGSGGVTSYTAESDRELSQLLAAGRTVEIIVSAGWPDKSRMGTTVWLADGTALSPLYHENVNCAVVSMNQQPDNSLVFSADQRIYAIYYKLAL